MGYFRLLRINQKQTKRRSKLARSSLESKFVTPNPPLLQTSQSLSIQSGKRLRNASSKSRRKNRRHHKSAASTGNTPTKECSVYMKVYILAFNDFMGIQKAVLDFLDTRREILNWCSVLPHSILIVSDRPIAELNQIFASQFPGRYFLLSEIRGQTSNGLLPRFAWDFINTPKSSGRWPDSSSAISALLGRLPSKPAS